MMKNIAIIPARSGSKGLPDKNIKELNGTPLMAYTIKAALCSGEFDEVMVSTDSEVYAQIAKKYGAHVPFLRSPETSNDSASSWAMVEEVLSNYKALGVTFDTFCLLQPTSPLRTEKDIQNAYELFREKAKFAVVSVCEVDHSPLWCGHLPENNELIGFVDKDRLGQRQEGQKFYRINGAIYIVKIQRFYEDKFLYQRDSYAYIMPQERSIDIDNNFDFCFAEYMMKSIRI